MSDLFKSPRALFDRAVRHINEYIEESAKVASQIKYDGPYISLDSETQENLHSIRVTNDVDLLPLGCVAFDAISCLRSVMDQVVFAATSFITGKENPKYTKFPFGESEDDARSQFGKVGKNKGSAFDVPENIHDLLISFGPFKEGRNGLWQFNRVRNTGIHRVIAPSAVAARRPLRFDRGVMGSIKFVNEWSPETKEAVFLREKGNFGADFSYQITGIDISFGNDTELAEHRVVDSLHALAKTTAKIIMQVEAECKRVVGQ